MPLIRSRERARFLDEGPFPQAIQIGERQALMLLCLQDAQELVAPSGDRAARRIRTCLMPDSELDRIDVRTVPPRDRHPMLFERFDALAPGEAYVLVNDHDPKPLYYQFMAERPGQLDWRYLEEGPEVWRVRVGKA